MKIRLIAATLLLLPVSAALFAHDAGHDRKRGDHARGGLERLDTDNDGRISRAEFDAGRAAREARMAQHADHEGKRKHDAPDFAALDTNKDGYIVPSEIRAYHERMRPQRDAERTARFNERFAAADLNRDGKLGRVEVQEKMPRMADRFNWIDENHDGFISRAELEAGRKHR